MHDSEFCRLIERLRGGDNSAVGLFIDRFGEAMQREVRFMLLDSRLRRVVSDSDVCQSVLLQFFVGLWAGKYDFQQPSDLTGLLKEMVRARVADMARRWTAQRRDVRRNVAMVDAAPGIPGSWGNTPSMIVAHAELIEEVRRRLSSQENKIRELRQQNVGWPEIAVRLGGGRGPEAIRKQYERAIARISKDLALEE
jgi:hypothetical protein